MRFTSIACTAAAVASSMAGPVAKRVTLPNGDIDILNYALTLEFLERAFYRDALKKFSKHDFGACGFDGTFYDNLVVIGEDEKSHVSFLSSVLGDKAVKEASYSFPYNDPKSFVALAAVLEGVGVSAYTGAAASIANKVYLTAAGSILAVEARHAAYVRAANKQAPFPNPYDTPLDFNAVFSLAAQFITGFAPDSPALPFKAFPKLTVAPSQYPYTADRSSVTFSGAYENAAKAGLVNKDTKVYAVFYSGLQTYYVPVYITQTNKDYKVSKIPGPNYAMAGQAAPQGQVYVVLSTADGKDGNVAKDENIISGVGLIEVIPK